MHEFTNHRAQQVLSIWRTLHLQTLEFSAMRPEATLADFEDYLRQRVSALEVEFAANEQSAEAAVTTKEFSGALANLERQREFRQQDSEPPQSGPEKDAWWKQRRAVLDEI